MLHVPVIRKDPAAAREALRWRNADPAAVDQALALDDRRKAAQARADGLKAEQNQLGPEIAKRKKQGADAHDLLARASALATEAHQAEHERAEAEKALDALLLTLPNLPLADVPRGADASANVEARVGPVPRRQHAFPARPHFELGEALGLYDLVRGAKLTGADWPLYVGLGARLERALITWFLDVQTGEHGYREVLTPFCANRESMTGTGQLPKFEGDMYRIADDDLFLIPTSEVTLTNIHRGEILDEAQLPVKLTAYSPCFRREAGAAGKDTRGVQRVHQFNKVELVQLTAEGQSARAHEEMVENARVLLERLGIEHRVLLLSTGDMGFGAAKTYDLEVWVPAQGTYREISSCSNCEAFQARRMQARFRNPQGKPELVHTLNGSGLAVGRSLVALLENHQQGDGSVAIPQALRPYLGGMEVMRP